MPQMCQTFMLATSSSNTAVAAGGLDTALVATLACLCQPVLCILAGGARRYDPMPDALGSSLGYGFSLLIEQCNNRQ